MILILHDTLEGYPFVAERMKHPCRKVYSPQCRRKYFTWIAGAWKAVSQSRKGDVIISLYDFQGILCWIFSALRLRRRHILGLNLLLKDKPTAKNRLASAIYRRAVQSPWFHTTVTSKAYQHWFNRKLGLNLSYPLLRDVYYDSYEPDPNRPVVESDGSVFCGGRNSRDWALMIELARRLPHVRFSFCMPDDAWAAYGNSLPSNVDGMHEVSMERFVEAMERAAIICMPVTTDAPAGLITMFQAAGYRKPIIATHTVTTEEYLTPERGYLLQSNDASIWADTIAHILDNPDEGAAKAAAWHQFVTTQCSEQVYVDRIEDIISEFIS